MRLRTRLSRLERSVGRLGCPACRDLPGVVILATAGAPAEPSASCAVCGCIPGRVVEIVEVVVEERILALEEAPSSKGRGR
jgi:hypothetical protein